MIYQGKARYPTTEVCLHTTATPGGWADGKTVDDMVAAVDRWHKERGWKGIGYHRLIAPNGDIGIGRSLYEIGAGVYGHNRGVIHITMVPVNTHHGIKKFEDYFTPDQRRALIGYFDELRKLTPIKMITGHNQYDAGKECPGYRVQNTKWIQECVDA